MDGRTDKAVHVCTYCQTQTGVILIKKALHSDLWDRHTQFGQGAVTMTMVRLERTSNWKFH